MDSDLNDDEWDRAAIPAMNIQVFSNASINRNVVNNNSCTDFIARHRHLLSFPLPNFWLHLILLRLTSCKT